MSEGLITFRWMMEKTTSTWLSQDACTGRWTRTAFGQAAAIRSMEAWPRWEEPLPAIQHTRRAGGHGPVLITWFTTAVNGAIPVVGSTWPIGQARCTSQATRYP